MSLRRPLSIKIRAAKPRQAHSRAFITLFRVHPSTVCRRRQRPSISTPTLMGSGRRASLRGSGISGVVGVGGGGWGFREAGGQREESSSLKSREGMGLLSW